MSSKNGAKAEPIDEHSLERVEDQPFETVDAAQPEEVEQPDRPQQGAVSTRAVPFAPVPMSWSVSQGNTSKGMCVVISIQTAEGDKVFFLEPSIGKELADAIRQMSEASENGVVYTD